MWIPRTESEIRSGIENGAAVETTTFEAKRELPQPGKNKDLAEDICAMTVDGGTLLYGLGGDDPSRPDRREPFPTQGVRERVDAVAQSGIDEPPVIDIYEIDSDEQPGSGYLCVVVPPSPRAPHMLTADKRYWGRGVTGNRTLSEGEVARLYDRRERWEVDRSRMLDEAVVQYPFSFDAADAGVVLLVTRPVAPGRALLRAAAADEDMLQFLIQAVPSAAAKHDPFPGYGSPSLAGLQTVKAYKADHWLCAATLDLGQIYQGYGDFDADGGLAYWQSPVVMTTADGQDWLLEAAIERAVRMPLGVASSLFDQAGFAGAIDIGVAILGSSQTALLVTNALGMALARRNPGREAIIHSDQGVQFASWAFSQKVRDAGLAPSVGAVGAPFDNAMVEAFWARMQVELLNRQRWKTRIELATAIHDYIEQFHNARRRHSALNMLTPIEYENQHQTTTTIAG